MQKNSLKIKQNKDKTFTCEWDKNDPCLLYTSDAADE